VSVTNGERKGLAALDALGPGGAYRSRSRQTVCTVSGEPAAELSLVPPVYVNRALAALRKARPLPAAERARLIARAGQLFATGTVGGLSAADYEHAASRVAGVPIASIRGATRTAAHRLARVQDNVAQARPAGAVSDWRDPLTRAGRAVWTRRGELFAVHASGAHPGAHSLWPEALALGYRVAVRPSPREPFTAHRLISALLAVGFPDDQVALLPADHAAGEAILAGCDLAYGGDDVIRKHADSPAVLQQRPGRSKILIGAGADWREHLDMIVDSVSRHGGAGCVNATAVFVDGDPAPLAEAVAGRLALLPSLPPDDDKAVLPVQPAKAARALERYLLSKAAGTRAWLGGDGVVDELGDGSAVLRPAVHQLDRPDAPQAGVELPFPCVWVAPWTPADGIAPLADTLVLTAVTGDERFISALLDEPSIGNLYLGDHPTHWTADGLPHDGYLADFLMRAKAVIRDERPPAGSTGRGQ
jgi:acyl-CoA reductase-like NAD-dependent aldehyde dehydrogenase